MDVYNLHGSVTTDQQSGISENLFIDHCSLAIDRSSDAFGIKIAGSGTTPNQILYSGEYLDPGTGNYALRNRIYRQNTGTFLTADTTPGQLPYVYTSDNPVMVADPSGHRPFPFTQGEGYEAQDAISERYEEEHPQDSDVEYGTIIQRLGLKPDIVDYTSEQFYEIKPLTPSAVASAMVQMEVYSLALLPAGLQPGSWIPEDNEINIGSVSAVFTNVGGVLFYTDNSQLLAQAAAVAGLKAMQSFIADNPQLMNSLLDIITDRIPTLLSSAFSGGGAQTVEGLTADVAAVEIEAI